MVRGSGSTLILRREKGRATSTKEKRKTCELAREQGLKVVFKKTVPEKS